MSSPIPYITLFPLFSSTVLHWPSAVHLREEPFPNAALHAPFHARFLQSELWIGSVLSNIIFSERVEGKGLKARNKGCNLEFLKRVRVPAQRFTPGSLLTCTPRIIEFPQKGEGGGRERIRFSTRTLFLEQVVDDSLPPCRYMTLRSSDLALVNLSSSSKFPVSPFPDHPFFFFLFFAPFLRGEMR